MSSAAHPPSTSSSLLVRLRDAADASAWRTFVDLYSPLVLGYARRRGLQDADAEDVVQQVFAQVASSIRTFNYDPQRGRFRAWLGIICGQAIGRQMQKLVRPGRGPGSGGDEPTLGFLEGEADPSWIDDFNHRVCQVAQQRIRGEFDAQVWRAFELTWVEDQEPAQAALAMGKPAAWVYKAKFKVVQRLKQEIEFLSADVAFFSRE